MQSDGDIRVWCPTQGTMVTPIMCMCSSPGMSWPISLVGSPTCMKSGTTRFDNVLCAVLRLRGCKVSL